MITYKETKEFSEKEIERLFLSVNWESGKYPSKIVKGLRNSTVVISAWEENKLIGLVRGLDDGETVAFIHYLLVDPGYQGKGIGQKLMEILMEKYKDFLHIKVMPSSKKVMVFIKSLALKYMTIQQWRKEICKIEVCPL